MFSMTGTVQGKMVSLHWENGILSGDKIAVDKAHYENTQEHGELGLVPSCSESNYLAGELPAYDLLRLYVFDAITHEENDHEPYNPNAFY